MEVVSKNKSVLALKNIFFEELYFKRSEIVNETSLGVEYSVGFVDVDSTNFKVKIVTNIFTELKEVEMRIVAVGDFTIDNFKNYDDETMESIKKQNTVAIIMPYIRSQVSSLTSQPDFTPVLLPTVDVTELLQSH